MNDPIIKFSVTDANISDMKERLKDVSTQGAGGYQNVVDAIKEVRTVRVDVEKYRAVKNKEILQASGLLNAEAKRITKALREIEDPLKAMKQAVDEEKAAKAEAKRLSELHRVNNIKQKMEFLRCPFGAMDNPDMQKIDETIEEYLRRFDDVTEENFEEFFDEAHHALSVTMDQLNEIKSKREYFAAEEMKREEEAEAQKVVAAEQAETQRKLDEQAKVIADAQKALDDKQKALDDEADKVVREAKEAQATEARAEEWRLAEEARVAAKKVADEVAEKLRVENLSDGEFLLDYFDKLTQLGRPEILNQEVDAEIKVRYDALLSVVHTAAEVLNGDDMILGVEG